MATNNSTIPADLSLSYQAHLKPHQAQDAQAQHHQARDLSASSSKNTDFYSSPPPRPSSSSSSDSSGSTTGDDLENGAAADEWCGCGFTGEWGAINERFVLMAEVEMFLAMAGVREVDL